MASEGQVPCVSPQEKKLRADGLVKKSLRLIGERGGGDVGVGLPRDPPLQFSASSPASVLRAFSKVLALCPQGHLQPCGSMTLEMPWVHNLNPRDNCLLWGPGQ